MNERCLAVLLNELSSKEKNPGSFTIPCEIGHLHIDNALADLGASISLMPCTMYEKLGLGEPKPTRMSLKLADSLEEGVNQTNFEKCDDGFDSETPIWPNEQMNTPYSQETHKRDGTQNEHLYSASANEIDEKRPELKELPPHLEYAYLEGDESCSVIISSKLMEKRKFCFYGYWKNKKVRSLGRCQTSRE
nr:hypothetical protein [Tanacetum cinerariifolium]